MDKKYIFNIGDKAVKINMCYATNAMWFHKFVEIDTVVDADEKFFTTNYKMDDWMHDKFLQHNGKSANVSKDERYYHLQKDAKDINQAIIDGLKLMDEKFKTDNEKEISRRKSEIEYHQKQIDIYEAGLGKVYAFEITQIQMRKEFQEVIDKKLISAI
jgi:hypothetical protein